MTSQVAHPIAIDTMVLVWGVRKHGPNDEVKRAGWLFDQIEKDRSTVIVPSIVVSEYLVPVPESDRRETLAAISSSFVISAFDAQSAEIAAELFCKGKTLRGLGKSPGKPGARILLKSDSLVVASAYTAGARTMYSGDKELRELAALIGMNAFDLPTIAPDLFQQ